MDFTFRTYRSLLNTLASQDFSFLSFEQFIGNNAGKKIALRHDVDLFPKNSLRFAKIESEFGIKGSYYFRIVPHSFNEKIIKEICSMGHEVGYHYEDISLATGVRRQASGEESRINDARHTEEESVKMAIESFKKNLAKLREIVPVKTICMHGSPISRWDSRLLWKYYDYHDFGIVGEPYFDIDFNDVLYLTDTGRRWDGESVSIRDKARGMEYNEHCINSFEDWKVKPNRSNSRTTSTSNNKPDYLQPTTSNQQPATFPKFHSTFDIIKVAEDGKLPNKIMMTFHPQRWTDKPLPWMKELVWQNVKNIGKYFLVKMRD